MTLDELLRFVQDKNDEAFYKNVESYLKTLDPETFNKSQSKTLLMHLASLSETEKIAFVLKAARNIWFKEVMIQPPGKFHLGIIELHRANYFRYIDAIDENNTNALIFAARANCLSAVKLLVESGINMYQETLSDTTALQEAALNLNLEMISFLMLHKPIPQRPSYYNNWWLSPLKHYFVMTEREKMGANTFIDLARNGYYEAVDLLLPYVPVNAINAINDTALICAAQNNHVKIIELLLKYNADINAKNMFGYTALFEALCPGHYEAASLLISRGANFSSDEERIKWAALNTKHLKKTGSPMPPPALCETSNKPELSPKSVQTPNKNNDFKKPKKTSLFTKSST